MTPKTLMLTTALAATLAGPVAAQSDTGQIGELGNYSVGEFSDMTVMSTDGQEVGRIEAVIEGEDGVRVLIRTEDRLVAVPIESLSLADDETALNIDRAASELEEMAAFDPAGQLEYSEDTRLADAMQRQGETSEMEMETLETVVVEDTEDDVTVITTAPSTVGDADETEGEVADMGDDGTMNAEDDTEMAGADDGTMSDDGMMSDGDATDMAASGDDGTMQTDEAETGLMAGAPRDDDASPTGVADTEMADTEMADGTSDTEGETGTGMTNDGMAETDMAEADDAPAEMPWYDGMTVGQLINMEVSGANGEDVGEIDYVFEDGGSYIGVIGVGGFLGLGEHTVAVPLSDFSLSEDGSFLRLQELTGDELDAMNEIDESALVGLPDEHEISY